MKIKNAKTLPKVYFGLHMVEGVAEYSEQGKDPYRIFIGEECLKNMDGSFQGRPLYVQHVDEVDLDQIQNDADGYVVRSFFNQADGKHWSEFIVVSDAGHDAIQKGWQLSNSYFPKKLTNGGEWHGVEYSKEITEGEYDHLALVENPRYEESIILTPEEFKAYNEKKEAELKKLANSKEQRGDKKMAFKLFKRTKVENSTDIEGMSVMLPKSKKEVTIEKLINDADEMAEKGNAGLADPAHKVKLHDGSYCNVGELVEKHKAMHDELEEMKAKKDDDGEEDKKKDDDDEEEMPKEKKEDDAEDEHEEEKKKEDVSDKDAKEKAEDIVEHEEEEMAAKKKNAKAKADRLKNAHTREQDEESDVKVSFSIDQVARGKARYGV